MYFLIILMTLFITSKSDMLYDNITGISSNPQYHFLVVIYTFICALFFCIKMHKVSHTLLKDLKIYHYIINLLTGLMISGSLFIYTQNSHDLSSLLHVYFSMTASLGFLILLFIYTRLLSLQNPILYDQIHKFYDLGLQFLAIITIVFARINSIIELLFTVLVSIYLYIIETASSKDA